MFYLIFSRIFYHNFKDFTLKGFILKLNRARDEDLVVTVLSQNSIEPYYRFYGARHSVLQMGYLIDYEVEQSSANFLPRIRNITHISFPWLYNKEKLLLWHRFIAIFEPHFRDVKEIDSFYFELLLESAKKWHKQSPKRVAIEAFTKVLEYEGRLHNLNRCVICNQKIENSVSLINKFLPTHSSCSNLEPINLKKVEYLFNKKSSIYLEDNEIDKLIGLVYKGF